MTCGVGGRVARPYAQFAGMPSVGVVKRLLAVVSALLLVTGCSGDGADGSTTSSATTSTSTTTTTTMPVLTLTAPTAAITVDGDDADWAAIEPLRLKLDSIHGVYGLDAAWVDVKVAHDDTHLFVLARIDDDYNWDADDARRSPASSVIWAIDAEAGLAHGAQDLDRDASTGRTDIWYWETSCPAGTAAGGGAGGGALEGGSDPTCSLHDLVASTVWNDAPDAAENSLLGSWLHTDPTEDAFGSYVFEISRPLATGDPDDVQFALGETYRLALAYWDPDNGPDGWEPDLHVVSSYDGWIEVTLGR